jgi:hypothetical protein
MTRSSRIARPLAELLLAVTLSLSAGCIDIGVTKPENPSFSVKAKDASASLKEMAKSPRPLDRPLLILAGYGDPGFGPFLLEQRLKGVVQTYDGKRHRVVHAAFLFNTSFEGCRRTVINAVERAFPSDDPNQTVEVDVIGISLGGTVARYAAALPETTASTQPGGAAAAPCKRLRIARLFTISSPHRGAIQADDVWVMSSLHGDLRTTSDFMKTFDARTAEPGYPIYPYVRLGDKTVGVDNAAPTGRSPYWLPNLPWEIAHGQAWQDPRILADIARRLRGEPPLALDPPAPLPETAHAKRSAPPSP